MLSHKISAFFQSTTFQLPAAAVSRGTNMHSCPEQLLNLPSASTCEYVWVCECVWVECDEVLPCQRGLLTAALSQESLLSDTGRGRAVTPATAGWGTEASSRCVRGQTSQWSVKLITAGSGGHCFVCGPESPFQKWVWRINEQTSFCRTPSLAQCKMSSQAGRWLQIYASGGHTGQSPIFLPHCAFSFSYCLLISLSLTCYDPFYCVLFWVPPPTHTALICLVWDSCLSCTRCPPFFFFFLSRCSSCLRCGC